jgi:hypothetical protein
MFIPRPSTVLLALPILWASKAVDFLASEIKTGQKTIKKLNDLAAPIVREEKSARNVVQKHA